MSSGSISQSVKFGSLTLIWKVNLGFEKKVIFKNFESTMSCSKFSRQLKIRSDFHEKKKFRIAGKLIKISQQQKLMFVILLLSTNRVELCNIRPEVYINGK